MLSGGGVSKTKIALILLCTFKKIFRGRGVQTPADPLLDPCMYVYDKQVNNVLGMNKVYPQDLLTYTLCLI